MPKWKGKTVSNAQYFHLRRSVENRIAVDKSQWGIMHLPVPYVIGGKKNSIHIRKCFFNR